MISSIGGSVTTDYRDSKLSPTKGWDWTNSADFAGGPLGGDRNFWRAQTSGEYFIPFVINGVTTVMEVSARTGIVQSYPNTPDVPIFERYFTGGQDSIRGYDERSVGPLDPNTNDAVGGDALLLVRAAKTNNRKPNKTKKAPTISMVFSAAGRLEICS